jgi:hypothetical protein
MKHTIRTSHLFLRTYIVYFLYINYGVSEFVVRSLSYHWTALYKAKNFNDESIKMLPV